jgi:AraC-like DNA-binding protein
LNEIPELSEIFQLFERSQHGITFIGNTRKEVGERMKTLGGMPPFQQFLEVLHIFEILSCSQERFLLHERPVINKYSKKQQERLRKVYAYIDEHYQQKIEISRIAALCNLGKEAFCRYFKRATGSTFTNFLNQYRISQAKRLLMLGHTVTETCYECGFESLSYFNRTFKKVAHENPSGFRKNINAYGGESTYST